MVAHHLGAAKPRAAAVEQQITDLSEQDFIPATRLPESEFNALLGRLGLPVTPPSAPTP